MDWKHNSVHMALHEVTKAKDLLGRNIQVFMRQPKVPLVITALFSVLILIILLFMYREVVSKCSSSNKNRGSCTVKQTDKYIHCLTEINCAHF